MSTEKIKAPFDWFRALAGASVVTRDGRKVLEIRKFDTPGLTYPIYAIIKEDNEELAPTSYTLDGKLITGAVEEYDDDLFMEVEREVRWVNFYPNGMATFARTEHEADSANNNAARLENKAYKVVVNG